MGLRDIQGLGSGVKGLGFPQTRGKFWRDPCNKDYSILASIFGVPVFMETTI